MRYSYAVNIYDTIVVCLSSIHLYVRNEYIVAKHLVIEENFLLE